MQTRSISTEFVSRVIVTAFAAALLLSACGDSEPLHTEAYYEALGSAKITLEIDRCVAEKHLLISKSDAAGADRFAKSNRSINCLNAALVEAARDAKTLSIRASAIRKARTREELHASQANAIATLDPWDARIKAFSEWESALRNVFSPAISEMQADYSNRSVLIETGIVGRK